MLLSRFGTGPNRGLHVAGTDEALLQSVRECPLHRRTVGRACRLKPAVTGITLSLATIGGCALRNFSFALTLVALCASDSRAQMLPYESNFKGVKLWQYLQ